jgi:hypothetical protein
VETGTSEAMQDQTQPEQMGTARASSKEAHEVQVQTQSPIPGPQTLPQSEFLAQSPKSDPSWTSKSKSKLKVRFGFGFEVQVQVTPCPPKGPQKT